MNVSALEKLADLYAPRAEPRFHRISIYITTRASQSMTIQNLGNAGLCRKSKERPNAPNLELHIFHRAFCAEERRPDRHLSPAVA